MSPGHIDMAATEQKQLPAASIKFKRHRGRRGRVESKERVGEREKERERLHSWTAGPEIEMWTDFGGEQILVFKVISLAGFSFCLLPEMRGNSGIRTQFITWPHRNELRGRNINWWKSQKEHFKHWLITRWSAGNQAWSKHTHTHTHTPLVISSNRLPFN